MRGLRRFYRFTDLLTGQAKPTENRRPTFEVTAVDNLQRISFLSVNFIYLVTLLKNFLSEKQTRLKLDRKTWIIPIFKYARCAVEGAILVPEKKSTFFGLQSKRLLSRS